MTMSKRLDAKKNQVPRADELDDVVCRNRLFDNGAQTERHEQNLHQRARTVPDHRGEGGTASVGHTAAHDEQDTRAGYHEDQEGSEKKLG